MVVAILGDRWRPQAAKLEGDKISSETKLCVIWKQPQLLEVSLVGAGTVLRSEKNARSMVERLRQATHESPPPYILYSYIG